MTTFPVPDLSDARVAFPASVLKWMPPYDEIPDEYKGFNNKTEANQIVSKWFFKGLPSKTEFIPNKGVDGAKALRALSAVLGSFEPKHEHKEAAAAYLLDQWFKRVKRWK